MTLPLADAAVRLRKRPGRPRKVVSPEERETQETAQRERRLAALAAGPRRLLDVACAAQYLSVSTWTVRSLIAAGRLPLVRLPLDARHNGDGREVRRLLVDIRDCDRLIEYSKTTPDVPA